MILFVYCAIKSNLKHKGMKSLIAGEKLARDERKIFIIRKNLRGKKNSGKRTNFTLIRMKISLRNENENFAVEHWKHLVNVANMRLRLSAHNVAIHSIGRLFLLDFLLIHFHGFRFCCFIFLIHSM